MVQGGLCEGNRGRQVISLLLKRFRQPPDRPHVKVLAERGHFTCHPSRFLVYSRCASQRDYTLTNGVLPWHKRQRGGGAAMTFEEILDQAIAMLQRRGRLTYGTLQRQFQLDDAALAALKDELLYSQPHVVDDAGRGLVWTGAAGPTPDLSPSPPPPLSAESPQGQTVQVAPPP